MPSMFNNRTSTWPNPEQSIGEECVSMGDLRIWFPIGPALAAYEILAKDLEKLLDTNKDTSIEGEDFPKGISFSMWMIGRHPESSNPTILFTSMSKRQRVYAKAMLKNSKLLDDYPGFKIRISERKPARYQAGPQEGGTIEITCDGTDDVQKDNPEEAIYMVDDSRGSCGALIAFGRSRLATMGGTLLINGTYYGISAQHGRYKFFEEPEDAADEGNPWCFDDDSDTEDSDLENLVDITSRESVSSFSDDGSSTVTFTSTTSTKDESPGYPIDLPRTTESTLDENPVVPSPSQPAYSSNPKIASLLPFERNDLDYEVFEIGDSSYHNPNTIDLPTSGYPSRRIIPNKIARTVVECPVWAATGTTGCVQGFLMRQPHYIKMEGSETFQEMWAVKLDRNTKPGDSGAWVVDSAGQLFGHIVAGDPMLGLAFIIPAYKIFDDIKSRFGEEPLLCPSTSVIQPYSAPNDGKVAEQPLLDAMRAGIDNAFWTELEGLFDSTITDEAIVPHARRTGYPMECGLLGWSTAILKEIVEMRLKISHILEPDWRLQKRLLGNLRNVAQEVPDGRTATFRGGLLDYFSSMTGSSNELMPATFSAIVFSAKRSSIISIVPRIGAYNFINIEHDTTSGAAEGESCNSHNGILSPHTARNSDIFSLGCVFSEILTVLEPQMQEPMQELHALAQEWQAAKCKFCAGRGDCAGWRRHLRESESGSGIVPIREACTKRRANLLRHLRESGSGSGIVPIGEARMQRQEPHPLDLAFLFTSLSNGLNYFHRRESRSAIVLIREVRMQRQEPHPLDLALHFTSLSNGLNYFHRRESRSAIVPIREARMLRREPHPLDQHGNQYIPRFTHRRALQDIPKLQPMRVALPDTGAERNFMSLSYARLLSLNRHPDRGLRIFRNLQRHESHRLKQIRFCYGYYSAHVLQSLDSGAVPTYDARQSRKRLLNALRRRDDNSQCSELREWECHDWYLFSMALMVLGIDGSDPLLRHQIETYFQEYFLSALSGVTEGGFFVERFRHVRRYGSSVGSRIGATRLAISRVGEDVL